MKGIAVCTCVAGNYVAFARVLVESFRRFHADVPFYVLFPDAPRWNRSLRPFHARRAGVVRLPALKIPDLSRMLLRYDRRQVLTAVKPALLRYVLERGHAAALYLDADMFVTASLQPLLDLVARHGMTLTPHVGPALAAGHRTDFERTLLYAGMYNGGFVGAANCEEVRRFVAWWENRLRTHCVRDVRRGLHYDQRWLDQAPALVADLHLVRDPGCNVAHWNLPDLSVSCRQNQFLVNGAPLRLFHFSGFDPTQPDLVSRFAPGFSADSLGPFGVLFRRYAALLEEAGWSATSVKRWPWDRSLNRLLIRLLPHCSCRLW
jgi:hypothetical protein